MQRDRTDGLRGQGQTQHREDGRVHPANFEPGALRQVRQNGVDRRLGLQGRGDHVRAPVERDRDLRRAARAGRSQTDDTRNTAQRLLQRAGDLRCHLVGRPIAGVDGNHDPGKIDTRKQADRQPSRRQHARQCQQDEGGENRPRMGAEPADHPGAFVAAGSSRRAMSGSRAAPPSMTTRSPGFTPVRISIRAPPSMPRLTVRRCALPPMATKTNG